MDNLDALQNLLWFIKAKDIFCYLIILQGLIHFILWLTNDTELLYSLSKPIQNYFVYEQKEMLELYGVRVGDTCDVSYPRRGVMLATYVNVAGKNGSRRHWKKIKEVTPVGLRIAEEHVSDADRFFGI